MKTLKIFQTGSGLWGGKVLNAQGQEIIRIAGLESPEAVQATLQTEGFDVQSVVLEA